MQPMTHTTFFEFCASLREEVLKQLSGVENSNGYLSWDTTTPNGTIGRRLDLMLNKYILQSREFGVHIVTRYSSCSNPNHRDYPTENRYDLSISYLDPNFIWGGGQLYQGPRRSKCPCSEHNKVDMNHVIDDIIYGKDADLDKCKQLDRIFQDISTSMQCAGNNKSRSGIREHLLRAIVRLNDTILPQTVDDYIAVVRRGNT